MFDDVGDGFRKDAANFAKQFVRIDGQWTFRRFNSGRAILVSDDERDRAIRRERRTNLIASVLGAATFIASAIGSEVAKDQRPGSEFVFFAGFVVATFTLIFGRFFYVNIAVRGEPIEQRNAALRGGWFVDLVDWARTLTYVGLFQALSLSIIFGLGFTAQAVPVSYDIGGMLFVFGAALCWLMAVYLMAMTVLNIRARG